MGPDDFHGHMTVVDPAEPARKGEMEAKLVSLLVRKESKKGLGAPLGTLSNAVLILRLDPGLAGVCARDDFKLENSFLRAPPPASPGMTLAPGPYPRQWTDADVTGVTSYIQRRWCAGLSIGTVEAAMGLVAAGNGFHPVRDLLRSLAWDGTPRIEHMLNQSFGVKIDAYSRAVSRKFMVGAVRRIMRPGCKLDTMPILEGVQGLGKSKCLRALFGSDWFTDSFPADIRSKDAAQFLTGTWCVEFAEVENLIKHDTGPVKAFMSRGVERYRPPYGRVVVDVPRQTVFVGSTNQSDYLRDETGNRRFWPVQCGPTNEDYIRKHRNQLWAEATHYATDPDETVWLDDPEVAATATAVQGARLNDDPWDSVVLEYVDPLEVVQTSSILLHALGVETQRQTDGALKRVGRILRGAGWNRTVKSLTKGGRPTKVWEAPGRKEGSLPVSPYRD